MSNFTRKTFQDVKPTRISSAPFEFTLEYADEIKAGQIVSINVDLPNVSLRSIRTTNVIYPNDVVVFSEFTEFKDKHVKMVLHLPRPMDVIPELVLEYRPIESEVIQSEIEKRERQIATLREEIVALKAKLK